MVMPRTLEQIDLDLDVERAIWIMERRAGADCREAQASKAKLDQLLDERCAVAHQRAAVMTVEAGHS